VTACRVKRLFLSLSPLLEIISQKKLVCRVQLSRATSAHRWVNHRIAISRAGAWVLPHSCLRKLTCSSARSRRASAIAQSFRLVALSSQLVESRQSSTAAQRRLVRWAKVHPWRWPGPHLLHEITRRSLQLTEGFAIHIAIHNNDAYDVLPMTCGAVRALPCR
jgi:hypothetical protein